MNNKKSGVWEIFQKETENTAKCTKSNSVLNVQVGTHQVWQIIFEQNIISMLRKMKNLQRKEQKPLQILLISSKESLWENYWPNAQRMTVFQFTL